MSERIQKQKRSAKTETVEEMERPPGHQADTEETNALLDEIDGVLEENAEQFIKDYTQKGGQ